MYTDFLAGIAAGDKLCLGRNQKPDILIVREKQLSEAKYLELFMGLWKKSRETSDGQITIIPHTYPSAAEQAGCGWLHLPYHLFQKYHETGAISHLKAGVSIHSLEEAKAAQELGASYVTAGHIFTTDCKKGMLPRGIDFLEEICAAVDIRVYAIGGIHEENLPLIKESGAAGACMMSEYVC